MTDEDIQYQADKAFSYCQRTGCKFEEWSVTKEFTDREFIKIKDKYEELLIHHKPKNNKLSKLLKSISDNIGKNNG